MLFVNSGKVITGFVGAIVSKLGIARDWASFSSVALNKLFIENTSEYNPNSLKFYTGN